jgi:hypothetical protein
MTSIRNRSIVAAIVAASCLAVPAAAADGLPATYRSDAAQSGAPLSTDRTDAAQSGWAPSPAKSTFPAADFRGGDSPADHPGASRAPATAPTTIEVVRPERTIVRDVDEALPLILSSTALVLVLAGFAITLVRTRMVPRPGRGH